MRRPENQPAPFDQERPDARGEILPGDHVLRAGETVHFTEHSRPNRAPDTTAARARHTHGRLRRTLDKVAPPGSKRRTAIAGGAVVAGTAAGTVGGGAERIGYAIGEATAPNSEAAAAEHSPFGVPGISVGDARRGAERNRQAHDLTEAAAEAGAPGAPSVDSLTGADANNAPPAESTPGQTPPPTGGVAAERTPDTGGVDAASSAN